jgi:AAA domain-containing protein
VLVAGIPGAGKSHLLRHLLHHGTTPAPVVLDSEPVRDWMRARLPPGTPYGAYRALVHLWHRLRLVAAMFAVVGPVVVHLPATAAYTRAAVLALAVLAFRRRYLIWVDAVPDEARHGQVGRGRVLARGCFDRHARRGGAFAAELRDGRHPPGWHRVTLVDRRRAARGLILADVGPPAR